MTSERDKREHLVSVIEDFDTAMLVTASAGGPIHGRPMGIAEVDGNGDLYFSTSIDSEKVRELEAEPRAAVVLQGKTKFASLSGTVRVFQDRATIDRLWKESWKIWFPEGKGDPKLALLRFDTTAGEYWDMSGARGITFLVKAAKAYVTGNGYAQDGGSSDTNQKVTLK